MSAHCDSKKPVSGTSSEDFLQILLDAIPVPVFYKDADGRYLGCNGAFEEYIQLKRDELIGRSVFDIAPPELAENYHRRDKDLLDSPGEQVYESSVTTRDGQLRHVVFHKATFQKSDGSVGGIIGAILDITDCKKYQQQLQARLTGEAALAACTRALVAEGSPDDVLHNALGQLLETSSAGRIYVFQNSYDTQRGLCMSQTHEVVAPGVKPELDNPDLQALPYAEGFDRWRDVFSEGGHIGGDVADFPPSEREILQAQGIVSILVLPIFAGGEWIGFIGFDAPQLRTWSSEDVRMLRTVAETLGNYLGRLRAEANRREVEQQLQQSQKMESLGILAGGVAHDFNNLLMVITGNVDLAMMDARPEGAVHECLQEIKKAAQQAAKLSNQMRAFSGQGHAAVQPILLNSLIREMGDLLRASVSRRVEVICDLDKDLPAVQADPSQMNQVVMNLLLNAGESIGDHPGRIVVRTSLERPDEGERARATPTGTVEALPAGEYVCLEITDTGCGMDAGTLDRIFEPFFTTKFIGRGLGLAAVQGIVRGHRGGILLDSRPGAGTTVRVLLPVTPSTDPSPPQPADELPADRCPTILLADDEAAILQLGRTMLERAGYDVLTATDGRQALDLAGQHPDIDVVLLDVSMPVMNGLEALPAIRKALPKAAVFLCSGYDENDTRRQLGITEDVGFLPKPFQMGQLLDQVARSLHTPSR
jgi:PAS domain S-box-containing protein